MLTKLFQRTKRVTVFCPTCGESGELPEDEIGQMVKCRTCKEVFKSGEPPKDLTGTQRVIRSLEALRVAMNQNQKIISSQLSTTNMILVFWAILTVIALCAGLFSHLPAK